MGLLEKVKGPRHRRDGQWMKVHQMCDARRAAAKMYIKITIKKP